MKKLELVLSFILFCFYSNSQFYPMQNTNRFEVNTDNLDESDVWIKKLNSTGKKMKMIEGISSTHKNDTNLTILNEQGQVLERHSLMKIRIGAFGFKNYYHRKYEYKNGLVSKIEYFNKKRESTYSFTNAYFTPYKIKHTEIFKYNKKILEDFSEYNSDSNKTEYRSYKIKKGQQKLALKYTYDYYPDKQRKQTRMYDGKNKLKYTWNYDCNPKGEIEKKNTLVCKNTGTDNKGRIIDATFNTNSKGEKTKTVNTYYEFNSVRVPVTFEYYTIKKGRELKTSEVHLPDSLEPFYWYKSYDKNGSVCFEKKFEYSIHNAQSKILKSSSYAIYTKGKMNSKAQMQYNEKGLPLSSEALNKKGEIIRKKTYAYTGDYLYTINSYNRKQKLIEVYTGKIVYY